MVMIILRLEKYELYGQFMCPTCFKPFHIVFSINFSNTYVDIQTRATRFPRRRILESYRKFGSSVLILIVTPVTHCVEGKPLNIFLVVHFDYYDV